MPDWKGLLRKGGDLAKQAKAEVDARGGIAEVAKKARSELENRGLIGGQHGETAGPPAAEVSAADQVRDAVGPDHPHPLYLLTSEEVATALRVEPGHLQGPEPNIADGAAGASWRVEAGAEPVSVDLLLYADAPEVEELTGYGDEPPRRLPGIGDRAAITREAVAVQRGGEVVGITVYGGGAVDWQPALESLARAVAERLPDFEQYAARMAAPGGPVLTSVLPTQTVAEIVGMPLDTPLLHRDDDEVRVTWRGPQPADDETDVAEVEVRHYVVDPMDRQRRLAQTGNAVERGVRADRRVAGRPARRGRQARARPLGRGLRRAGRGVLLQRRALVRRQAARRAR